MMLDQSDANRDLPLAQTVFNRELPIDRTSSSTFMNDLNSAQSTSLSAADNTVTTHFGGLDLIGFEEQLPGSQQPPPPEQPPRPPEAAQEIGRSFRTELPLRPDTSYYRQELFDACIDPDRISTQIGLYEPIDDGIPAHPEMVRSYITDPQHGISHGADVRTFSPLESTPELRLENYAGRPDPLADYITDYAVAAMTDMSNFISDNLLTNPDMRVLNVSQAFSPMFLHRNLMEQFQADPEGNSDIIRELLGEESGNQWIFEMTRENRQLEQLRNGEITQIDRRDRTITSELNQALMDRIVGTLQDNPNFEQAMEHYRDVTRSAADAGQFVVVAAANDGFTASLMQIQMPPGTGYNWYCMSDHVITVGAVDTNNTPDNPDDDQIWPGSSNGTERWHPTVSAQGCRLPTNHDLNGETQGTSFAAPQVSTTIALMLEQNPDLTFDQVRQMLIDSSTPLPGAPVTQQGAGRLNITRAVIAARDSRGCGP